MINLANKVHKHIVKILLLNKEVVAIRISTGEFVPVDIPKSEFLRTSDGRSILKNILSKENNFGREDLRVVDGYAYSREELEGQLKVHSWEDIRDILKERIANSIDRYILMPITYNHETSSYYIPQIDYSVRDGFSLSTKEISLDVHSGNHISMYTRYMQPNSLYGNLGLTSIERFEFPSVYYQNKLESFMITLKFSYILYSAQDNRSYKESFVIGYYNPRTNHLDALFRPLGLSTLGILYYIGNSEDNHPSELLMDSRDYKVNLMDTGTSNNFICKLSTDGSHAKLVAKGTAFFLDSVAYGYTCVEGLVVVFDFCDTDSKYEVVYFIENGDSEAHLICCTDAPAKFSTHKGDTLRIGSFSVKNAERIDSKQVYLALKEMRV